MSGPYVDDGGHVSELCTAHIATDDELAALPDGSVIWYWVTYDHVEIHQQLMKHGDWWRNANDPDDMHEYFPTTERLSITLLRRGWTPGEAQA